MKKGSVMENKEYISCPECGCDEYVIDDERSGYQPDLSSVQQPATFKVDEVHKMTVPFTYHTYLMCKKCSWQLPDEVTVPPAVKLTLYPKK